MNAKGLLDQAEHAWAGYLGAVWSAGQWSSLPEEERAYGVRHLADHLKHAEMVEELYVLIDDPEFHDAKLGATHSIYSLCSDIGLALDTAFDHNDLVKIGHFGFLHANYSEGRFRKPDVLELHPRDRNIALQEARLFRERPRFKLLLLLSLKEIEMGQSALASELIGEATSIEGISLPESDGSFMGYAVTALLKAGCNRAPDLLQAVFQPEFAAHQAARIAPDLNSPEQEVLLSATITSLKERTKLVGRGEKLMPALEAVADSIVEVEDATRRESLFKQLEELVEGIKTGFQEAIEKKDTLLYSLMVAVSMMERGTGIGNQQAARAYVGAARVRSGAQSQGFSLLERAIEACDEAGIDSSTFGAIGQALRTIPSPQSTQLFRRLVAKTAGSFQASRLRRIIEVLADDRNADGLAEVLAVVAPTIDALGIRERTPLLEPLALAYAKAGQKAQARRYASYLTLSLPQLPLLARNPLVNAEHKLATVRFQVELAALSGERDQQWTQTWLSHMARWLTSLDSDKSKASGLKELLQLTRRVGENSAVLADMKVVDSIRNEEYRAEAMQAVLDASQLLVADERAKLRKQVLERTAPMGDERARCRVWASWLETASRDEFDDARNLQNFITELQNASLRAESFGRLAGALARVTSPDEAILVWFQVALADQEASTRSLCFAAATVIRARSPEQAHWSEVLQAVHWPDPEVASQLVEFAADACEDAARLSALEQEVRKLRHDQVIAKHICRMYLSLARGWARLGNPGQGARLALLAIKKGAEVAEVLELARLVMHHPLGRTLLLKLIPITYSSGSVDNRRFAELASDLAKMREEEWAREAFRQLYFAALERDTGSKWRDIDARAGVIRGIAQWGHAGLALNLAKSIPMPEEETAEAELLHAAAHPSALVQLGRMYAEIYRMEPGLGTISEVPKLMNQALAAAEEVKDDMFQGEICSALVEAWVEAKQLELPDAPHLLAQAEMRAINMANERNVSPWQGLSTLARSLADFGEGRHALTLVQKITKDEDREELLIDLTGRLCQHSFSDVLQCWQEIATAEGRLRAAWNINKNFFRLNGALSSESQHTRTPHERKAKWASSFRHSFLTREVLPAIILILGMPVIFYGLAFKALPLVRQFLSGPYQRLGVLALLVATIVISAMITHLLRNDIKSRVVRLGASLLLLPFSPFILGFYLYFENYRRLRPSFRIWKFLLRKRLQGTRDTFPLLSWHTATSDLDGFRQLLRTVASESEPFDILFGSLLYFSGNRSQLSEMINRFEGFRPPTEAPEKIKKSYRDYEEIERSYRWTFKVHQWIVKASSKLGIWITGGFLAPILLVASLRRELRARQALRYAKLGDNFLSNGKASRAVPFLHRAIKLSPEIPQFWHDYAVALAQTGKTDEAVKAHQQATEKGVGYPDEPQFWYGMGFTLWRAGRDEEALAAFEQVLKIAPPGSLDYTEAQRGREYCLSNLGRRSTV